MSSLPPASSGGRARRGARRMTVRLLGLDCSPRDNSNSGIMLEKAFEKLDATYPGQCDHSVITLRELHIEPCKACPVCGKKKDGTFIPCVREDEDDVQNILDAMVAADGMLIATPVYFGLPSISSPSSSCARVRCATRTSSSPTSRSACSPRPGAAPVAPRRPSWPPGCPSCVTAVWWSATATAPASSAPTAGPAARATSSATSGASSRPSRRRSACSRSPAHQGRGRGLRL